MSFLKKIFSRKTDKISFPKISLGFRGEDLEYETQNDSLYISSTWTKGRKIYMDDIQHWKSKNVISDFDKSIIFKDIVEFLNKKCKERPIVVINTDHDKELWENLCKQYTGQIENIEYQSDKEKEQFLFDSLLENIHKGGTLIVDNKTIKIEEQFLNYWQSRDKK